MMQTDTSELAHQLLEGQFGEFFLFPDREHSLDAAWEGGKNANALIELANNSEAPVKARFLACEVLFKNQFTFVREVKKETIAGIYAEAMAKNYTAMANSWGLMYATDDKGPVGHKFLLLGEAAIPALRDLLTDDSGPMIYIGSETATLGNARAYRIKDAAAYYLGKIKGIDVAWHDDLRERDKEIEQLEKALGN